MSLFPIFLKLTGRRCLVVGAGEIAVSKIASLVKADAEVTVVSPEALPEVEEWAGAGDIVWFKREFETSDLDGLFLVVAATDSIPVNKSVYEEAARRGILANAVDDPPHCDFYFGSVVQRGDLQIAISTAGESPALAQRLRREIDAQLSADTGEWLSDLGALRREVLQAYPAGDERKALLHRLAHREVCTEGACLSRRIAFPERQSFEQVAASELVGEAI